MSCFISELLIPQDSGSLPCQHCRRRDSCQFVRDQPLRRAARQGYAAAQLLEAEADRLMESISRSDDISHLMNADGDLERALSQALNWEMAQFNESCAQVMKRNP